MKFYRIFLFAAMLVLFAGCNNTRLRTGEYRISKMGRDDFAVVYEDLIFLHIQSPELAPGNLSYWDWAGKYKVLDGGEVELDMDHETKRRWKFYFQFLMKRDGLGFNDWSKQTGYMLTYQTPGLKNKNAAPAPAGSSGVNPEYRYQDLSSSENQ